MSTSTTMNIAICVLILAIGFEFGSCMKCYQCSSEDVHGCDDPFDTTFQNLLHTCHGNYSDAGCVKAVIAMKNTNNTQKVFVQRKCFSKSAFNTTTCKDMAREEAFMDGQYEFDVKHCSICDTPACNTAVTGYNRLHSTTLCTILFVLAAFVLRDF